MKKEEDEMGQDDKDNSSPAAREEEEGEASAAEEFPLDEAGGLVGVKTFEDLLEIIGTSGIWNIMIFALGCYCTFTHPMIILSYQFVGATPDHWCRVDVLIHANWSQQQVIDLAIPNRTDSKGHENCLMYDYNYGVAVNLGYEASLANRHLLSDGGGPPLHCPSRDFNYTQYHSTLVTEWDLVCERLSLYSTTQAVTQLGVLIGAGIFGYLLDLFGRRRVVLVCSTLSIICAVLLAVAPDYQLYVLLKTLTCIFLIGFYVGCFVNMMELCSPSQRTSVGSMFVMPFALGFMVVPGIAYFVRSWRWLQAAYAIPLFPLLSYFWLLPESPRWLIAEGRYEDALKVVIWAAKVNRRPLPSSESLLISMRTIAHESGMEQMTTEEEEEEQNEKKGFTCQLWRKLGHVFVLVATPSLRRRTLICFFCWFAVSMVYYGVSLNSTNLSTDPYLYVFLGGVTEVPAYLLLWPAIAYLGRKVSLMGFYMVGAVTLTIIATILITVDEASPAVMMFLSLSGKVAVTAAFHLIYVFTAELYPTKYRSLAVGEASMMARFGSMTSPYINDILGTAVSWGPTALFAVVSVVAAGLSFFLPETEGADLTEEEPCDEKDKKENGSLVKEDIEVNGE